MDKQFNHIDKDIYTFSLDISKRFRNIPWTYVGILLGGISLYLYMNNDIISSDNMLSSVMFGIIFMGVFSAGTIICYYLFGDCRVPYYRPTKEPLSRQEYYFSSSNEEYICRNIISGNIDALTKIPKSIVPQIVVIKYVNKTENVLAIQAFENENGEIRPITDIMLHNKNIVLL